MLPARRGCGRGPGPERQSTDNYRTLQETMNTPRLFISRLAGSLALSAALMSFAAWAAPFAYVPNEKSGTISVIDTENDTVVAEIKAGDKPRGLAASIDGKTLYVSDQPNNALVKIDLEQRVASGTIDLGESPEGVSILRMANGSLQPRRSATP